MVMEAGHLPQVLLTIYHKSWEIAAPAMACALLGPGSDARHAAGLISADIAPASRELAEGAGFVSGRRTPAPLPVRCHSSAAAISPSLRHPRSIELFLAAILADVFSV